MGDVRQALKSNEWILEKYPFDPEQDEQNVILSIFNSLLGSELESSDPKHTRTQIALFTALQEGPESPRKYSCWMRPLREWSPGLHNFVLNVWLEEFHRRIQTHCVSSE